MRRTLLAVTPLALLGAAAVNSSRTTGTAAAVIRTQEPFASLLLNYREWRHPSMDSASAGDGKTWRDAYFAYPMGIEEDRSGRVYVTDREGHRVWRLDPDGSAHVVAGTGRKGRARTDVAAREADLGTLEGLTIDRDGNVLFVDRYNYSVLKLTPDGRLVRVAGNGWQGYSGDGGRATDARLDEPFDVRVDSAGNIYIADFSNHRIRMVDRDGIIRTVAGTGQAGYSGDGGPATRAQLNGPYSIYVDAQDRLLIADSLNHVIRRVERDGTIRTIAGSGARGYSGDGGPATAAQMDTPQGLFVDSEGVLLIDDEHNHVIRRVGPDGVIRTVAGSGKAGYSGDGGPAVSALMNDPESIWIRRDGTLMITDAQNGLIRAVDRAGVIRTVAGRPH